MNLDELKNVSESVKRLNPDLFMDRLRAPVRKRGSSSALERESSRAKAGRKGMARDQRVLRISIIGIRRRTLDADNFAGACKQLRDCIASSFNLDDAEKIIDWQYAQQQTRGREGIIVVIELFP